MTWSTPRLGHSSRRSSHSCRQLGGFQSFRVDILSLSPLSRSLHLPLMNEVNFMTSCNYFLQPQHARLQGKTQVSRNPLFHVSPTILVCLCVPFPVTLQIFNLPMQISTGRVCSFGTHSGSEQSSRWNQTITRQPTNQQTYQVGPGAVLVRAGERAHHSHSPEARGFRKDRGPTEGLRWQRYWICREI